LRTADLIEKEPWELSKAAKCLRGWVEIWYDFRIQILCLLIHVCFNPQKPLNSHERIELANNVQSVKDANVRQDWQSVSEPIWWFSRDTRALCLAPNPEGLLG